ncbi:tRNA selenocysteine 1-associated protein 1 [Mortierella sp. AD031]|nr:tRNA selenocysteine 1-associated protein 1 [Mortierella sp. AD031]
MGELEPWMDENWIRGTWFSAGEQVSVKMIRDKYTGASAGYCFVELSSPAVAAKAINTLNGVLIPGTNKVFKLNWASGGGMASVAGPGTSQEFSVFVGDLSPEVTEFMLVSKFQERYMSCRSAKIMTDATTGISRGYGFVRFGDESEQLRALHEMQGVFCGSRPIRISMATPKNKVPSGGMAGVGPGPGAVGGMGGMNVNMGMAQNNFGFTSPLQASSPQQTANQFNDPNNTTVFVGGLSGVSHEDELRNVFAVFGEITYVKIPPGKGCGFVQFVHRQSAEMAISQLNGYQIGSSRVRLSWGRAQNEPKPMSPLGSSMMGSSGFRGQNNFGFGHNRHSAPYGSYPGLMAGAMPGMMQTQSPRDPMERMPIEHQNRAYMERKEAVMDQLDGGASWRGSGAIYA